jgi:predicted nucleic acid-binding protein
LIVVDASVIAAALGDDGIDGRQSRARLSGERLAAPELIDLEVASVWRRLCAAGHLDLERADRALADLEALRLDRVSHRPLLRRCWELRANVTVYDAAYIALAEHLEATLLTADHHLANAPGTHCHVELMR